MLLRELFAIVDGSPLWSRFGAWNCWRAQRIAVPRSASQKKGRSGITDEFSATPRVTPVIGPDPAIARLDFHEEIADKHFKDTKASGRCPRRRSAWDNSDRQYHNRGPHLRSYYEVVH